MSQLEFIQNARTTMLEAIAELEKRLDTSHGATLVGEPYILVESEISIRGVMRLAGGKVTIGPLPNMLTGVPHFSPANAKRAAAEFVGPAKLVPVFARDWQRDRLNECRHALAQLDELLAKTEAAESQA